MKTFEDNLRDMIADDERTIRLLKIRAALLIVRLVIEVGLIIAVIVFLAWLLK